MLTLGAVFGLMVIDRVAEAALPFESLTLAVIRCVPTDSEEVDSAAPEPRAPPKLELQEIDAARLPSSGSEALPVKLTEAPMT